MVERLCPQCQHGNPLENRFCGSCGTTLEQRHAPQHETRLATTSPALPVQAQQVGKAVALSLATLAAEAGLAWLRRRVERLNSDTPATTTPPASTQIVRPAAPSAEPTAPTSRVTIWSQRVIQTWENGTLTRQTVERSVWRREG
jgi:hypothetical protein